MEIKERNKFIKFLKEKWQGRSCPMCQVGTWSVQDTIFELREFHGGGLKIGKQLIMPVVPVTCDNCGNTVLINAITAGFVERENEATKPKEEKNKK